MHDNSLKQTLFENKYLKLVYLIDYSLIILEWKNETENMSLADFNKTISYVKGFIVRLQPKRFFNNLSNFNFVVDTELTSSPKEVFSLLASIKGFGKQAMILPKKNVYAHMAIFKLLDKLKPSFVYDIFINEDDALEWLKS